MFTFLLTLTFNSRVLCQYTELTKFSDQKFVWIYLKLFLNFKVVNEDIDDIRKFLLKNYQNLESHSFDLNEK